MAWKTGPKGGLWGGVFLILAACSGQPLSAPDAQPPLAPESAYLESTIYLSADGPVSEDAEFHLPWLAAHEISVTLASIAPRRMTAQISCNGDGRLHLPGDPPAGLYMAPDATRRFTLPGRNDPAQVRLVLSPDSSQCDLRWGEGNRLSLLSEKIGDPQVARLDARQSGCALPDPDNDALVRVFFRSGALSQTCPHPTGHYAFYGDETEALALRLEKLTGSRIDRAVLAAGDLDMALDFSNAPHFDEIVVSYLNIRADISTYLIARALAVHAARGTKVRVVASSALMLEKDRQLLEGIAARYPSFQIQYYSWTPEGPAAPGDVMNSYQRSNHIKLFAALSSRPGASFAMVGGRNLSDMFFYPDLVDKPRPPFLNSYAGIGNSLNPMAFYHPYEDFELALFRRNTVEDVLAQFGKFWNRSGKGERMVPTIRSQGGEQAQRDGLMRHFISLPWADGQDQEQLFVEMFDSAQEEILAISPFTYPPPAIDAALARAAARGVRVRVATRMVSDEPPSTFVNGFNAEYYRRRADEFEIRAYDPDDRLMHTKLVVIDRRLSVVISSNLNWRSFLHDSENGFIFLDRAMSRNLAGEIERALAASNPLVTGEGVFELGRRLSAWPWFEQFF